MLTEVTLEFTDASHDTTARATMRPSTRATNKRRGLCLLWNPGNNSTAL